MASEHNITKPFGSGNIVNGAVVQGQFTFLSGEICSNGGLGFYGSRTEGALGTNRPPTEPYGNPNSASSGNARGDWVEVIVAKRSS